MSSRNIDPDTFYTPKQFQEVREAYNEKCNKELEEGHLSNFLWNLPFLYRYPGIIGFEKALKGYPVVITGLGPSLNKQLSLLKEFRSCVVLIAVDATLPLLLKEGITPDIVVVVDPTEKQVKNFEGVDTTQFVTIAPVIAHPAVFRKIDPKFMAVYNVMNPSSQVLNMAPYHTGKKGALPAGVLTSGSAIAFAAVAGCGPIMLIGHDLSWPTPDKVYAEGTFKWKQDFQKLAKFKGGCSLFPDIHGKLVLTHQTFLCFWGWLKDVVERFDIRVINCTEAGILKTKRIRVIPFKKALKTYAAREIVGVGEKIKKALGYQYLDGQVEKLLMPPKRRK